MTSPGGLQWAENNFKFEGLLDSGLNLFQASRDQHSYLGYARNDKVP